MPAQRPYKTIRSLPKEITRTENHQVSVPADLEFQLEWDVKIARVWKGLSSKQKSTIEKPQYPYQEESIVRFVADVKKVNREDLLAAPIGQYQSISGLVLKKERRLLEQIRSGRAPIFEMMELSQGTFRMGASDPDAGKDAWSGREVAFAHPFSIGVHPVTVVLWQSVMGANFSRPLRIDQWPPVEQVSWFDCIAFCNALSEQEGLNPAYVIHEGEVGCDFESEGYRLPTEAEWEYAARAREHLVYAGSNEIDIVAWHLGNSENTAQPVGEKSPNAFGLYDMSGNVSEWCWDRYEEAYARSSGYKPMGPATGDFRVFRGGSWRGDSHYNRLSFRDFGEPSTPYLSVGFRLCRTIRD